MVAGTHDEVLAASGKVHSWQHISAVSLSTISLNAGIKSPPLFMGYHEPRTPHQQASFSPEKKSFLGG